MVEEVDDLRTWSFGHSIGAPVAHMVPDPVLKSRMSA